ncbi:hypothetical protein F5050DRAFT_1538742, partial [Lentinula boryana]
PGTTLREEDKDKASKGNLICLGSQSPAYVVYIGNKGKHGVFYAWLVAAVPLYSTKLIFLVGPLTRISLGHSQSTSRPVTLITHQLAHQFYDEFLNSGVAKLLAENKPTKDERFIVVEGVAPAAYKNRKSLIMDGLQFRGGVVYRYIGSIEAVRSQFNKYKAQGL